ncbi:IclR family transcriptional regulator [Aeromicrobium sp. CTD01-1L150]|uniref:IclR family transcriptional regulator n=1 Tax=Aeromicrobium sp. CTD01-1L150 TaxID=3341830 RepID=UPI0035C1D86F
MKARPAYAIASVDHALHIATMLQLEGRLTVSEAADRLGVARSTAHRLLSMLVYRDFAVQDEGRTYHAGPVLELATHSRSEASRLRAVALPHLQELMEVLGESVNLIVRASDTARFIASVECDRVLRVGSREGMVFPAHHVSGGMVLLADLLDEQLESLYAAERYADRREECPDLTSLRRRLTQVRRQGFSVNDGGSERGVVAVGRPVRRPDRSAVAGVSVSLPSVRYDRNTLPRLVATLGRTAEAIERDFASALAHPSAD